jgi:ABC-type cobalamin/Fe3+-siderophores transport system ATPase subunit
MIEIKNLSIAYGERVVLKDFSASITKGSITAIIGPNGSGKSSLLSAISADIPLASGEIQINGRSVCEMSFEEMAFLRSFAQQSHTYWMAYSVEEILWLGHDSVSSSRFNEIVDALDIRSFLTDKVTVLSGGQLQRVEIARALMRQSPLVLLDEPFASQDLQSITRIIELMQAEKDNGITFVVVAHAHRADLIWADAVIDITN